MKWIKYVQYVLIVLSIVALATMFFLPQVDFKGEMAPDPSWLMYWMYLVVAVAVIIAIASPIVDLISNPKSAIRALIGIGIVAVVVGISYALSSDVPVVNSGGGFFDNPFSLKFSDTVIFSAYIVLGGVVLSILFSEIKNAFK